MAIRNSNSLPVRIKTDDVFPVDAGNISVADLAYIERMGGIFGKTAERACRMVHVAPGKYCITITVHMPDALPDSTDDDDNCSDQGLSTDKVSSFDITTEGTLVFGDVCYLFSDGEVDDALWTGFLDTTNYLREKNEFFAPVDTSSDGVFHATIEIEQII